MKIPTSAIAVIAALLAISCNKQKAAIDETKEASQKAIETRRDQIGADAKSATEQSDANATIEKAGIEAAKVSGQAQLDADKKKVEAEADAAKAKVDAEK